MADEETRREQQAQYGFGRQFLNAHPEIKRLVARAVEKGYTISRFEYELRQTNWYRQRTEARREWDVLTKTQPRQAQELRRDKRREIKMVSESLGVRLTGRELDQLSLRAITQGWTPAEMQYRVGRRYEYGEETAGAGTQAHREITEMAAEYGIPMSKRTSEQWARQVAMGVATVENFRDRIVEMAKGRYTAVADDIDRGVTVDMLFDAYRQEAARTLGVNPETIDIADRRYRDVFSYKPEGEKKARAMTLDEFSLRLRTDRRYGFQDTTYAQNAARQLAAAIQRDFGQR